MKFSGNKLGAEHQAGDKGGECWKGSWNITQKLAEVSRHRVSILISTVRVFVCLSWLSLKKKNNHY